MQVYTAEINQPTGCCCSRAIILQLHFMLFTSLDYFLFLTGMLAGYYLLPARWRNPFLIAGSAFFCMYVNVTYLLLITLLILFNYLAGMRIGAAPQPIWQRRYLQIAMVVNIGVLVFFKYLNFLLENLFGIIHLQHNTLLLNIALPIGLSYYTFQHIGYTLDIYRGAQQPEKNFGRFMLFVLFFPKLMVGPIERAKNFLPQLQGAILFHNNNLVEGCKRIAWGLFKKLVVADRISMYVMVIDADPDHQSGVTILFACILYAFQVYADFSGYADIAIGSARLFGFNLMENFNRPFFARNLSEYWRRWHISLSSWVNDYIFNPILLKRRKWGNWSVFYALTISFVLIGLWHGASWNYVVFGLLQALVLSIETLTKKYRNKISKQIPGWIYQSSSIILTFLFIVFSLVIFRSGTFDKAYRILHGILYNHGSFYFDRPSTLLFIIIGCVIMMTRDFRAEFHKTSENILVNTFWLKEQVAYALLLIYTLMAAVFDGGQFIYFSF